MIELVGGANLFSWRLKLDMTANALGLAAPNARISGAFHSDL
jgi:hypothetical protein